MKPKISCIIITLNEERYLPRLLDSLKNQTWKDFELIISDYNSTDKTKEIAKSYGCKIVKGGNYTVGRNNGARVATSNNLLFLDADCYLPKDFLELNFKAFEESRKGAATVELKPLSNNYIDKIFYKLYDYWSRLMVNISPHCAGCGIFVKKDVYNKLGGFNEKIKFAENHEFVKRTKPYGYVILPKHMYTSVRRIKKEGRFKFICKYIYAGCFRLFLKEIDKDIFEYDDTAR